MGTIPGAIDAGVGIGEIIVDKYRVDAILGHGGMGVVAMCTHLALNERVAIKMLRRDVLDDADAVERFMREAQAAVKLKSEYVARVTDVGRSQTNVPYMVMEYLEGHDLGELLDERGSLGMPWAIELTLQACEALAEAHSLDIVHRDVKPTNLFVTWRPDGSALIKVLDFGISKALTDNRTQLTLTQSLLGTPAYMSPEQMRCARKVDARTDIWSLGTVLYELLEGRRPFEAESFSEMCVKVAVDPPGAMTHTPLALQQVVLRCLEKSPEQRYPSMADLARDLVPFSHDPHQAQVLVERMARTLLRRSQVFERNPSQSGLSGPVRALTSGESGPVRASMSAESGPVRASTGAELSTAASSDRAAATAPTEAAGSNSAIPVARSGRPTGSTPAMPMPRPTGSAQIPVPLAPSESRPDRRTGSGPVVSETLSVTRPRRRNALVIAAAIAAAAAIGVAVSVMLAPAQDHGPHSPAGPAHAVAPAATAKPALADRGSAAAALPIPGDERAATTPGNMIVAAPVSATPSNAAGDVTTPGLTAGGAGNPTSAASGNVAAPGSTAGGAGAAPGVSPSSEPGQTGPNTPAQQAGSQPASSSPGARGGPASGASKPAHPTGASPARGNMRTGSRIDTDCDSEPGASYHGRHLCSDARKNK